MEEIKEIQTIEYSYLGKIFSSKKEAEIYKQEIEFKNKKNDEIIDFFVKELLNLFDDPYFEKHNVGFFDSGFGKFICIENIINVKINDNNYDLKYRYKIYTYKDFLDVHFYL